MDYHYETGFKSPEENVQQLVLPNDRRPGFCAEALNRGSRLAILTATFLMIALLIALVIFGVVWPEGLLDVSGLGAAEMSGTLLAMGFLLFVVYGALAANNPRITGVERVLWYLGFALTAPIAFPLYWFVHVRPVRYQPAPQA